VSSYRHGSLVLHQSRRPGRFADDEAAAASSKPAPFIGVPSVDRQRTDPDQANLSLSLRDNVTLLPQTAALLRRSSSVFTTLFLNWAATAQSVLDEATNGWALSYADLTPESPKTIPGAAFLATNTAYLLVGMWLLYNGDLWFGFWTDACAIASFNYHYNQLMSAGETDADAVRLALFLDYLAAAVSMTTATLYMFGGATLPTEALIASSLGLFCLGMSWVYEYGRPYMIWHSLWHLLSAYSGYLIGAMHSFA
jgi:hypothetical protein